MRPRRLGVGIVRLEGQIVEAEVVLHTNPVDVGKTGPVIEERTKHVASEVCAWRSIKGPPFWLVAPTTFFPPIISSLEHVGQPPDIALCERHGQIRMPQEVSGEQPIAKSHCRGHEGKQRADTRWRVRRRREEL